MKNVRVVSDGTSLGTHIYDTNGTDITKTMPIMSVVWRQSAGEVPVLELSVVMSELDVVGKVDNG